MVTAAIGAGLSLASAIYGGIKSSQANNRARRLIQQQRDDNRRWYDTRMAEDYTMRTDAQAAINRQRELLNEQYDRARRTGVVSGATDEAVAMQKEAANKAVSDTTTEIASQASAYKDNVERQFRAQDAALNQQQAQSHQQQAAQTAQAASQAVNAGINLVGNSLAMQGAKTATADAADTTATPGSNPGFVPSGLNTDGTLKSAPTNTDLTALGNQQLGGVNGALPQAQEIGYPVQKKFA